MKNLATFFKGADVFIPKACISRSTFNSWVLQFREGRTSVRDKSRPGKAEAVAPTMVANVEVFVNNDRKVALQVVANQFNIG